VGLQKVCCHEKEMSFLDADYAAIEARIVNWLAGQEDALEEYRAGVDRYKRMASVIYGVPEENINKFPQRFLGKTVILAASYGMGPTKFRATCAKMGYDLPLGMEEKAVKAFRSRHKKVVQYWYDVERAVKTAILKKGQAVVLRNVRFIHQDIEGLPFLLIRLPSGRKLAYPKPRIVGDQIVHFGNIKGTTWGDVHTYGAKVVENITQAVAADVMATGAANAEREGYAIATLVHDQAICYYREGQTAERFVELLTTMPSWADNLPLAAEGALVPYYRKD
jgi:DNA polymerase